MLLPSSLACPSCHCEAADASRSNLVEGFAIATHIADARNDSSEQPDKSGCYKNLEVKNEDNIQFEETPLRGKT